MTEYEIRDAFHQYGAAVYRFAWRMTGSPTAAEDIAQEVFLTLLRQPSRFDPGRGPLRPFLLGIARNLVRKRYRDEMRWDELENHVFVAPPVDLIRGETVDAIAEAVHALPPLQREALLLAQYDELSMAEIARAVGSEVGAVKARLNRARENLRRMLAPLKEAKYGTTPRV